MPPLLCIYTIYTHTMYHGIFNRCNPSVKHSCPPKTPPWVVAGATSAWAWNLSHPGSLEPIAPRLALHSTRVFLEDAEHTPLTIPAQGNENCLFVQARVPSACAICLGRFRHKIHKCSSGTLWSGEKAHCWRNEQGRLINPGGSTICSDWQCPFSCTNTGTGHYHECSGCGKKDHRAQDYPRTQKE